MDTFEPITEKIKINFLRNFPSDEKINSLKRGERLEVHFGKLISRKREKFGEILKMKYPGFSIGIHVNEPIIVITKLISVEEIDKNIVFLEQCARDYDKLACELMNKLIVHLGVEVDWSLPLITFNEFKMSGQCTGKIDGWRYAFHGFDCSFENLKTEQYLEASLICGNQFGQLDPWFFIGYIESTKSYIPLHIKLYDRSNDGKIILKRMLEKGILKEIESNIPNNICIVLADKYTSHIKPYTETEN